MDISHYIQLSRQRLSSKIRIPKVSNSLRTFENYSKFAFFIGAAITLGVLAFKETKKSSIEEWLKSNPIESTHLLRWIKSYQFIESNQPKLIREVIKTLPFTGRGGEVLLAKNAPIVAVVEASGSQHILVLEGYEVGPSAHLEWDQFDLSWDQLGHLFEQLVQQIQNHNKLRKSRSKPLTTDPYELRY